MRICLIANPNSPHTRRCVESLFRRGHELHLIGEHALERDSPSGCVFHDLTRRINVRKVRYLTWALAVRSLVRRIRPDIVHALGVASAGWLGAGSGFHPFMVSAMGSDLLLLGRRSIAHRMLSRWAIAQADHVACISQELAARAGRLGVPAERIDVLCWGVDVQVFHPLPDRRGIREKLGVEDVPTVLSIRAMREIYHPLDLVRAIPGVLAAVPTARFIFFTYNADPALLARVQAVVAEQGVAHAVTYVGSLSGDLAIADYYRVADVAVSVPESDGTPFSVLEAMSCGTPVVASDLPSLRDWIKHGSNGLLVPVGDVEALRDALVRLLLDPGLRREMGRNAVNVVRERGDSRGFAERIEQVYRHLVDRGELSGCGGMPGEAP